VITQWWPRLGALVGGTKPIQMHLIMDPTSASRSLEATRSSNLNSPRKFGKCRLLNNGGVLPDSSGSSVVQNVDKWYKGKERLTDCVAREQRPVLRRWGTISNAITVVLEWILWGNPPLLTWRAQDISERRNCWMKRRSDGCRFLKFLKGPEAELNPITYICCLCMSSALI